MKTLFPILLFTVLAACRTEEPPIPSTGNQVTDPNPSPGEIKGLFVLNEGNMGSNKASLDYFDYTTGVYSRNIFAERNPGVARELGDVGNDLQIHGERLYAVINCSNLVEVMDVGTARHIGTVSIPNGRSIAFEGPYAYVSSYAGPVQPDPDARPGMVVKVDTATLRVVAECTVGYQPEELAVVGGKLYVANSGGYRAPDYDRTVSVIDLDTFTEIKKIDVAINLHRLEVDRRGYLWVSSRGDHRGTGSKTCVIDPRTDTVVAELDLPNGNMALSGGRLYVHGGLRGAGSPQTAVSWAVVDTDSRTVAGTRFIQDGTDAAIETPYGLAVNPASGEIFVTDATDYVTPGTLHCYSPEGILRWSALTGDIPAHIAFTARRLRPLTGSGGEPEPSGPSPYITQVFDYRPAPGQFTNLQPRWTAGDTREDMNRKVLASLGGNRRGLVSLGGFGGYVVLGFDHTIENVAGRRDFRVSGNAFGAGADPDPLLPLSGSSEPGVIRVARDANGNGLPDDEWYEIAGSAHTGEGESWYPTAAAHGNIVETRPDYRLTYRRPASEEISDTYIYWEDNYGASGHKVKNPFHAQSYYPLWIDDDELTFAGTALPQNAVDESGTGTWFMLYPFGYGYADNAPNTDAGSAIDIDWAVDAGGRPARLPGIDFIRVHTGVNQQNGWVGEVSTEITGVEDLHLLGVEIDSSI